MHGNGGLPTFLAAGDASMLQETRPGALGLADGAHMSGGGKQAARTRHAGDIERPPVPST
jgi:hypothetical protein